MTRKDVKGDQPSGGETTWTNTGATRYGRGQHKTGSFGDDMLRPSPNHGTQRLPNDDDDDDAKNLKLLLVVYFAKGEPRNVEYCKVFLWKCNIWVLRTRKLPDANFLSIEFCVIDLIIMLIM